MDTHRSTTREILGYVCLVLVVFGLEMLVVHSTNSRSLAISSGQLLTAVFALTGVTSLLVLLDVYVLRRSRYSRLVWYGLTVTALMVKAAHAGLFGKLFLMHWVFAAGLLIGYFLPFPRPRREGLGLFLVVATMRSGWPLFFRPHGVLPSLVVFLLALIFFVSLIVLLWVLEQYVIRGGGAVRGLFVVGALCLFLVSVGQWYWLEHDVSFDPRFRGVLPEVHHEGTREELPNIIVIGVDDLRWDMVPPRAPAELSLSALERLGRDGIEFNRAFSPASSTPHAFASFFSGLLPVRHGTLQSLRIHPSVWLYPQLLQQAGYRTAGFVGGGFVSRNLGFSRGYDRYWEYSEQSEGPVPGVFQTAEMIFPGTKKDLFKDAATESCFCHTLSNGLDWIDRGEDPFYLFLHTYQVHDYGKPYPEALKMLRKRHPDLLAAPGVEELIDPIKFKGIPEMKSMLPELIPRLMGSGGKHFGESYRSQPPHRQAFVTKYVRDALDPQLERHDLADLNVRQANHRLRGYVLHWWTILKHLYMYNVELTDRHLDEFLSELEDRGLYEDSLIVLMSDHGEGLLVDSPSVLHGGYLNEMLIRVPLYIKLPGNEPSDRRVSKLVQLTDVFPSIFRHVGLRPEVPVKTFPDTPVRDLLVPGDHRDRSVLRGSTTVGHYVRGSDYKYIDRPDTKKPLHQEGWFRVRNRRIGQTKVQSESVPDATRTKLQIEMARMVGVLKREELRDDFTMDRELREELKGLGYLR